MEIDSNQLEQLKTDLVSIKTALQKNNGVLQDIFNTPFLVAIEFVAGFAITALSMLFYFVLQAFGSFEAIPAVWQWTLIGVLIVVSLGIGFMKIISVKFSPRAMVSKNGYFQIFIKLLPPYVNLHYYTVCALTIFFGVFFGVTGQFHYMITALGIGAGLMFVSFGSLLDSWEFTICGFWQLVTGIVAGFITQIHPAIWMTVVFGIGYLMMGTLSLIRRGIAKKRGV